ncbi:2,3,4,5-tetrahydropyridine-2,6-dicarboxylate N-succinyltransferase [Marinagarivorans cellulosilyticus]|uniref:2,3,4,5-tetrahydropyridine-2,6-dicarboxylate N-succinyltransferase n=1 Tax=Marinagarivorans cellulosilyticus TaxID=2721545 RepID=A0AAN1WIS9_9GAMM|nr:2,3,4,5-tetrahydropyridine-2,6-dicarboxylate N-succinyltransferase [Marinagarivorans cellulosilyticus]BCD98381.1 2,3,4,5-tetrahydropyridine-2,6-dicarboxylate N-succinyltransferase [Marinagarivorans cellulosilyticus]
MTQVYALGLGIGHQNSNGDWLDTFFALPLVNPENATAQAFIKALNVNAEQGTYIPSSTQLAALADALEGNNSEQAALARQLQDSQAPIVAVVLSENNGPKTVPEAYLKLHLLSHRLVKPHETSLEGIFASLPNVAWTNQGPIDLTELPAKQLAARLKGQVISVDSVDKFPKMTDYVVPSGVRIADTARVRLGAHIGQGTTIMHEGFVNFNAGTLGVSMVEGRISAGVIVGEGSDLGGGCSTMGTLSGGGNIVISVGKESLIGANAGIGIPLGDRCTVESGLYITAGTKVILLDDSNQPVKEVKARDLASKADLLFRRNSLTGAVECKTNKTAIALNEELHANN